MPTISRSLVQPLVTPSTALLTSARARPCTAACASSGRIATRLPSFCSIVMPDGRGVSSLPFGPWTITVLPSILTVTPFGIAIGFFPIRDIRSALSLLALGFQHFAVWHTAFAEAPAAGPGPLPNIAKQFAAEALPARLASCHHAFRRGQDVDPEATEHPRNLGAAHIDAAARTRHARQIRNHRLIVVAILQIHAQDLVAFFFRRLEVRDIALFLQNAGNLRFQLGGGYVHFLVPRAYRVADARQHVCDRIGQPHRLLLLKPLVRSAIPRRTCQQLTSYFSVVLLFGPSVVSHWPLVLGRQQPTASDHRPTTNDALTTTTSKLQGSRHV